MSAESWQVACARDTVRRLLAEGVTGISRRLEAPRRRIASGSRRLDAQEVRLEPRVAMRSPSDEAAW